MSRLAWLFLFLLPFLLFSQEDPDALVLPPAIKVDKKISQDPKLLVVALTAGKSTDREKFDAIFAWVATNIRYNYRQYFSLAGSFYLPAHEILRRKSVVCLGYANLMDTLCALAGITNTTVYGYAADELFDVHDSVFTDNHAWNAVKLDGLWYVYDVTWSTGMMQYQLRPFSRLVRYLLRKLPPKFKQKKIKRKRRKKRKVAYECPTTYKGAATYYKPKYFNHLFRNILFRFHPRYKRKYIYQVQTEFYLCQPELFAATHCPNDPIWSLGAIKNTNQFENDSAYYYLHDSIYKTQVREGRECPRCDSLVALPEKEKIMAVEKNAYAANTKNRFIIAQSEQQLGAIHLRQTPFESSDSLQLLDLDSAQLNFLNARRNLKLQKANNAYEALLHKRKNKKKMSLLYLENRSHRNSNRKKIRLSMHNRQEFRRMETKSGALSVSWRNRARQTGLIRADFKTYPARKGSEMKHARKQLKLDRMKAEADSLSGKIILLENQFDSIVESISLNVWQQGIAFDTLWSLFGQRIDLRYRFLDNYKKPVEDLRIKIINQEFDRNNDLDFLLYGAGKKTAVLYKTINKLIARKQKLQRKCLNDERDLVKVQKNPMSALEELQANVLGSLRSDYCWVETGWPYLASCSMGFNFLREQQIGIDKIIPYENWVERNRASFAFDRIKHRYRKYNLIVDHNEWLIKRWLRKTKDERMKILRRRK